MIRNLNKTVAVAPVAATAAQAVEDERKTIQKNGTIDGDGIDSLENKN